jgi:hypothetical protein
MHLSAHKGFKVVLLIAAIGAGMFVSNHFRKPAPEPLEAIPETSAAAAEPALKEVPRKSLKWDEGVYFYEGAPFTGVALEAYPDGKKKQRWSIRNGKWHGLVEEWYPTGVQSVATQFQDGVRHGESTYWNPDGTVQKKQQWIQDVLQETPPPAP